MGLGNSGTLGTCSVPCEETEASTVPTVCLPEQVKISTLPNGLRVASQDTAGQITTIGLIVNAGTRHETHRSLGASQVMAHLAFKGSRRRSRAVTDRGINDVGGMFSSSFSRESVSYVCEGDRGNALFRVLLLAENVFLPEVLEQDEDEQMWDGLIEEIEQSMKGKQKCRDEATDSVIEALHATAFGRKGLGLPLHAQQTRIALMKPEDLRNFFEETYRPDQMVLVVRNFDHDALVKFAQSCFADLPAPRAPVSPRIAEYVGGVSKIHTKGPAHVAMAFKGVSLCDADMLAAIALSSVLGNDISGNKDTLEETRLCSEILNKFEWITFMRAFTYCYKDVGLFGIHGSCRDGALVNNLAGLVGEQAGKLATRLSVKELDCAKNRMKRMAMEKRDGRNSSNFCEEVGRNLLGSGSYCGLDELFERIDSITIDCVAAVGRKITSSVPCVVVYGDDYETYEHAAIGAFVRARERHREV